MPTPVWAPHSSSLSSSTSLRACFGFCADCGCSSSSDAACSALVTGVQLQILEPAWRSAQLPAAQLLGALSKCLRTLPGPAQRMLPCLLHLPACQFMHALLHMSAATPTEPGPVLRHSLPRKPSTQQRTDLLLGHRRRCSVGGPLAELWAGLAALALGWRLGRLGCSLRLGGSQPLLCSPLHAGNRAVSPGRLCMEPLSFQARRGLGRGCWVCAVDRAVCGCYPDPGRRSQESGQGHGQGCRRSAGLVQPPTQYTSLAPPPSRPGKQPSPAQVHSAPALASAPAWQRTTRGSCGRTTWPLVPPRSFSAERGRRLWARQALDYSRQPAAHLGFCVDVALAGEPGAQVIRRTAQLGCDLWARRALGMSRWPAAHLVVCVDVALAGVPGAQVVRVFGA